MPAVLRCCPAPLKQGVSGGGGTVMVVKIVWLWLGSYILLGQTPLSSSFDPKILDWPHLFLFYFLFIYLFYYYYFVFCFLHLAWHTLCFRLKKFEPFEVFTFLTWGVLSFLVVWICISKRAEVFHVITNENLTQIQLLLRMLNLLIYKSSLLNHLANICIVGVVSCIPIIKKKKTRKRETKEAIERQELPFPSNAATFC